MTGDEAASRPIALHAAVLLLLAEFVAGVAGLVVLGGELDSNTAPGMSPYADGPTGTLSGWLLSYCVVFTVSNALLCLWFGTYMYLGRRWARSWLSVVLGFKTVSNLVNAGLVGAALSVTFGVPGFGGARVYLALAASALNVATLVAAFQQPVTVWLKERTEYRKAKLGRIE